MKRQWVRYTAAGLGAYTLFLVLTLPAPRLYAMTRAKLPEVQLWEIDGSAWHGHAALAQIGERRLENLEWRLQPWALLWGRAQLATTFHTAQGPAEMVVGRGLGGRWYFSNVDLPLPAAVLEPAFHLAPGQLGGRVDLHLDALAFAPGELKAVEGTLTWSDAALVSPWPTRFGKLALTLGPGENGGHKGTFQDQGGALNAQGVLDIKPSGAYQFTATLAPRDTKQAPNLQNGLRMLATPQPDGRYKINVAGQLPLPAKN